MSRVALTCLALAASAAGAHPTDTPVVPAADKKVCRYLTPTGSLMGARICKTRKEWAAADDAIDSQLNIRRRDNTIDSSQGAGNRLPT